MVNSVNVTTTVLSDFISIPNLVINNKGCRLGVVVHNSTPAQRKPGRLIVEKCSVIYRSLLGHGIAGRDRCADWEVSQDVVSPT